ENFSSGPIACPRSPAGRSARNGSTVVRVQKQFLGRSGLRRRWHRPPRRPAVHAGRGQLVLELVLVPQLLLEPVHLIREGLDSRPAPEARTRPAASGRSPR